MFGSTVITLAGESPALFPARQQMAVSLGFHIILACFGVAFPTMIYVMHRRGVVRDDPTALRLAKRWSKVSAVVFAIGAVSGTVLSFEMGLLWPGLMGRFGDVLGLPFALEGLSFFTEAIFLGLYLYGWGRMQPRWHLKMLIPMAMSGIVGSFCVVAVNSWMNYPTGFTVRDGTVTDVRPWAAMFNPLAWLQFLHMWLGAFLLVGLVVSGVYAAGLLRGRTDAHHRLGFLVPFAFASVAALIQPFVGHVLGLQVGNKQTSKLAAFELALHDEPGPAPLRLGGFLVGDDVRWSVPVPRVGSVIARGTFNGTVPGLDSVPRSDWPPVNITHWSFQVMVGIGLLLALAAVVFWLARRRGRDLLNNRWFLRFCVIAGPLAIFALEMGWVATEVGRQPWTVWQVLRTTDAATTNTEVWWSYIGVLVIYLTMSVAAFVVLRSMARRWRAGEEELPSPYGPAVLAETQADR
ncbi:cytochrome ubiquinol oxidase subunit I [Mycobacterium kubicae]|nr:cytochrome ubiquinol oxidase subunit I [Mycobacterium kubicae]ORV95399.1 cytochrome BD ubiquinol oxidase subunit I [Mycobacterium kubicae]